MIDVVFVVQHEYEQTHNVNGVKFITDEYKFIGVDSSREKVLTAVKYLRTQPGFIDYPDNFHISEYELDKDHWTGGFITEYFGLE